ncbi:phenylalanine 4-monooxygenase [Mangrovivirga sp. M17]|uniref:Phenylalanine-4-hydroxylase n=1 Tax=Mangrovivirga halotolerans TaxID=2993936 RepID=A0ABT3RWK5_9BACT|nr:phenylalanine 4-monooxygenase [Mangrovivirga halotolerans]MCX2745723.1 phenylalanine 4-monooxygenase [Mangrovivirga halotolerans]
MSTEYEKHSGLPIMNQDYEAYTEEDFKVWKMLFDRQKDNIPVYASEEYIRGLELIKFKADEIPNIKKTNDILRDITGWEIFIVPGLIDDDKFFQLMSNKKFPSSTWLRSLDQLDYLEEPDMFHDIYGHVPLLTNQAFVDFLQDLSKLGLKYIDNPHAIHLLSRVYWFTVEFGLIRENGELKIYGAGILSSKGETEYATTDKPEHIEYDVDTMLDTSYRKDVFQTKYFIIDSYEQLYNSIPEIDRLLAKKVAEHEDSAVTK